MRSLSGQLHARTLTAAMTAAALGVPAWIFFGVILFPLFGGRMPSGRMGRCALCFPSLSVGSSMAARSGW